MLYYYSMSFEASLTSYRARQINGTVIRNDLTY